MLVLEAYLFHYLSADVQIKQDWKYLQNVTSEMQSYCRLNLANWLTWPLPFHKGMVKMSVSL